MLKQIRTNRTTDKFLIKDDGDADFSIRDYLKNSTFQLKILKERYFALPALSTIKATAKSLYVNVKFLSFDVLFCNTIMI